MKYVSIIDEPTDLVTKKYVDDKTAEIYTSVTDDFNDYSRVDTDLSTSILVESGYVRPSISAYAQNFTTDEAYNELLSTSNVVVENGNAYQSQGTVGVTETSNSDSIVVESLVSKKFTLSGTSMSVNVTPTFTTPTPILAHSSLRTMHGSSNVNMNDAGITKVFKDSSNNTYYAFLFWSTTSVAFSVFRNSIELSNRIIWNQISSSFTALSDTHIKTVGFTESPSELFFALPYTTSNYMIYRINKTTNTVTSTTVIRNGSNLCQGIDILHDGTRLHVLFATSDVTNRDVKYVSFSSSFPADYDTSSNSYLVRYTGASEYVYKVKLVSLGGQRVAWSSFCRRTAVSTAFGIIDHTVNGSFPHNYRTDAANVTTAPLWATGTRVFNSTGYLSDSNGCGTMVFDNTNNFCYLVWGSNGNSDTGFGRIATNSTTALPVTNLITVSPFDYFAPRDCEAFLRPTPTTNGQRVLEVFFHRAALSINAATRTNLIRANVSISSAGVFSYSGNTTDRNNLVENPSIFLLNSISLIPLSSTENHYDIYTTNDEISLSYIRHANLTPELEVELTNLSGTTLSGGSRQAATSGDPLSFNLTGVTNGELLIRFRFLYRILTEDFTGTNRSVSLSNFTIEQTGVSGSATGTLISKSLVTDRIVKSVTLDVTQEEGSGNSVIWEVASLADNWVQVSAGSHTNTYGSSNGWTVTFNENYYGSQLRVKATMNKGAGNNTIASVPKIQKYVANVKNVVTVNDIFPIQINLLKLSLYVNTQVTANRYGYKNQMVDLFSSAEGISDSDGMTLSSGAYANTSGSNKTLTSARETADISTVSSIIVVADASNGVTYQVRRGEGVTASEWATVTTETVYTFQTGTPTDKVQIRAIIPDGGSITGWAYLYN